ncbi:hypothetical protein WME90_33765 [Sorangium sp. So ce375]|uniref:hypothetical protein n=1 Tax=Sorangium sp. So ce375 TaxID=3133306 RepID=UPI003F5C09BC
MALMLGATAFSAGCGDDTETTGSGGGTTASSTTGEGGAGQGGAGEGGGGDVGGAGQGGAGQGGGGDAECVTCSEPLLGDADTADLCESSVPKYQALTECICANCGAAEGDACFASCNGDEEPSDECTACGMEAATTEGGACLEQGTACLNDRPE